MAISRRLLNKIRNNTYQNESLSLNNQNITDAEIVELASALKENSYIIRINLSSNRISDTGLKTLLDAVPNLIELDISYNGLTADGAYILAQSGISVLDISGNLIGDDGFEYFFGNKAMLELTAEYCRLSDRSVRKIFTNDTLQSLNLSNNTISPVGFETLPTNSSLRTLIAVQAQLTSQHAWFIAQNRALKKVCLSTNNIGPQGTHYLAGSQTIEELDLSQNNVGKGAGSFGQNRSIRKLILFRNNLEFDDIQQLRTNNTLVDLDLSSSQLDDRCETVMREMTTLEFLSLASNHLSPVSETKLLALNLKRLNLAYNQPLPSPKRTADVFIEDDSKREIVPTHKHKKRIADHHRQQLVSSTPPVSTTARTNGLGFLQHSPLVPQCGDKRRASNNTSIPNGGRPKIQKKTAFQQ